MNEDIVYKIEFKKKANLPLTVINGLGIMACITVFGMLFYNLSKDPKKVNDFAFLIILLVMVNAWVIDRFLWQIKGIEQLIISDHIEIIKCGKLFKSVTRIEFQDYESVSYDNDQHTSFLAKLYGLRGGKIEITYLGRKIRIGQDISLTLAQIVTKEIDSEIRSIKRNYV